MAPEDIQVTIVVDVGHVHGLHEHASVVQGALRGDPAGTDLHEVDPVIKTTAHHVLVAIPVHVARTHAPLVGPRDIAVVERSENPVGALIVDVQMSAVVQQDQVVVAIPVHVGDAHAIPRASGLIGQDRGRQGEGLCLQAQGSDTHGAGDQEKLVQVHAARSPRSKGLSMVRVQGSCSRRVAVGTTPPTFCRIGSRSLLPPVYLTVPSMFTSDLR